MAKVTRTFGLIVLVVAVNAVLIMGLAWGKRKNPIGHMKAKKVPNIGGIWILPMRSAKPAKHNPL